MDTTIRSISIKWRLCAIAAIICPCAVTLQSEAADPATPTFVFPPINAQAALGVVGFVMEDGKRCIVIESYHHSRQEEKPHRYELKTVDMGTGSVRTLKQIRLTYPNLWFQLTRDGRHILFLIDDSRAEVLRTSDGEIVRSVSFKGLEAENLQSTTLYSLVANNLSNDVGSLLTCCTSESPYVMCRVSLDKSPQVLASMDKGPFQFAGHMTMIGDEQNGRIAAVLAPKRHKKKPWKLLLMDMTFRKLAETDVPPKTSILSLHGGNYPLLLLSNGPRWTLLSLDHDKLTPIRSGTHNSHGNSKVGTGWGAISPDGHWLVTIRPSHDPHLAIWRTTTGELAQTIPLESAGALVRFDTSGRYLSCTVYPGPGQQRFCVWDFKALIADAASGGKTRGMQQSQDPRMGGFRNNGPLNRPGAFDQRNRRNRR